MHPPTVPDISADCGAVSLWLMIAAQNQSEQSRRLIHDAILDQLAKHPVWTKQDLSSYQYRLSSSASGLGVRFTHHMIYADPSLRNGGRARDL
jgi:hypothetical protein